MHKCCLILNPSNQLDGILECQLMTHHLHQLLLLIVLQGHQGILHLGGVDKFNNIEINY